MRNLSFPLSMRGIERNIRKLARKMDAISVEAMLQDACVNHANALKSFLAYASILWQRYI
jgi:hypothetical protein